MNRTGGTLVAELLARAGVRTVFAIASVHNLPILRALHEGGIVRTVDMRHEQAAVHAADAYARVTGELGVAVVSTGPGTANAMGGLFEASFASSRVLLITGQVPSGALDHPVGHLHEAPEQHRMLQSVCGTVRTVRATEEIESAFVDVVRAVRTGRPRPGAFCLPIDLQEGAAPFSTVEPAGLRGREADPVPDELLASAVELLAGARRPLIWAGGGVTSAGGEVDLLELARAWGAGVITSREGRGAVPEDDELSLGCFPQLAPLRSVVEEADVVLAVGTQFQMYSTDSWRIRMPGRLIHLDVDPAVVGRTYPADVALVGDLRQELPRLRAALPVASESLTLDRKEFAARLRAGSDTARSDIDERSGPDHLRIRDAVRAHLPRRAPLVRDATVPAYVWADRTLPVLAPRTSVRPTAAGIGPGLPFGIGAAVGSGLPTVVIQGDGGAMLSIGELAAAVQSGADLVLCVFDDRGYGVLRDIIAGQGGPQTGVDLCTPDFTELASSFGATAVGVSTADGFDEAFAAAVERGGTTLIHIDMRSLHPLRR